MSVHWIQTFVKMAYVKIWKEATVASVTLAMNLTPVAKTVSVSHTAEGIMFIFLIIDTSQSLRVRLCNFFEQ